MTVNCCFKKSAWFSSGRTFAGGTVTRGSSHRAGILVALCVAVGLLAAERVSAHEDPPGCGGTAGTSSNLTPDPVGPVQHGDTVCYIACFGNPADNCNITGFDAELFFPDLSSVQIVIGASPKTSVQRWACS